MDGDGSSATTDDGDDREEEPTPAYRFGDGPAPVRTGGTDGADTGGRAVRPLRSVSADAQDQPPPNPSPVLRALVHDLNLHRLLDADEATREARNAALRRAGTGAAAVALAGVLVYAVFPVGTGLDQRAAIDRTREQIEMLSRANERLEDRAERLRTDPEIERLAREQYGLVKPGEEPYAVLPPPGPTPTTAPPTAASTPDPNG